MPRARAFTTTREVTAGCRRCHGDAVKWRGSNAQGLAAQHHDKTRHQTWVKVVMEISYGSGVRTSAEQGRLI
jgi:cytochrome c551/c552